MEITVGKKQNTLSDDPQMIHPKKGERFRCLKCGMAIEITEDCKSTGGHHSRFECCGQPLTQE